MATLAGWKCPSCERHPGALAAFDCQACGPLCPACAAAQHVGVGVDVICCLKCLGPAQPLRVRRAERLHFAQQLWTAFSYPVQGGAKLHLALAVLVIWLLTAVGVLGGFGFVFALATTWAHVFHLVRRTAAGEDKPSTPDFETLLNSAVLPAVRGALALAPLAYPAFLLFRSDGGLSRVGLIALLVAGALYTPMALMVASTSGGLLRVLNPLAVGGLAWRLGHDYLRCAAGAVVLLGAAFAAMLPAARASNTGFAIVLALPGLVVALYLLFVLARTLGLLLYIRGDEVEYGTATDYLDVVSPRAVPSGVLPTRRNEALSLEASGGTADASVELRALLSSGAHGPALALYDGAVPEALANVAASEHLDIGRRAAQRGEYPLAVRALRAAAAWPEDPSAPHACLLLARLYQERLGDPEQAQVICRFVLNRYPDSPAAERARTLLSP
jgi:hypothetical protein